MKIAELINNGTLIEHYPCDQDENGELESNGSVEEVWEYKGSQYAVKRNWQEEYFGRVTLMEV